MPRGDPHEFGGASPQDLQAFSAKWRVDAAELRDALDEARHVMNWPVGEPKKQIRDELRRISEHGAAFAEAIESASDDSIHQWLACDLQIHPARLLIPPGASRERQRLAAQVRRWVDLAQNGADALAVNKAPHASGQKATSPASHKERSVVEPLADLWLKTHGTWPKVTNRGLGDAPTRRLANEGGRFVIEAAKLLELNIGDQRLRTILEAIKASRPAET